MCAVCAYIKGSHRQIIPEFPCIANIHSMHLSVRTVEFEGNHFDRLVCETNEYIVSDARCAYNLQPIWILDYPRSFHQKPSHSLTHPNLAMASCVSNDNNFETFYICRSSFNLLLPLCSWQYIFRWIRAKCNNIRR